MRPARVRITGALDDGETPGVKNATQPGEPGVQAQRTTGRITPDLQDLTWLDRNHRTSAVVERILIRHDGAQRVVTAAQVHDNQISRARALRLGDVG
jgi:hypothetical protein